VDRHRLDAELAARAQDAQRDLAAVGDEDLLRRRDQAFLMRKSFWPNSTALAVLRVDLDDRAAQSASISFISFMASTMQSVCPVAHLRADLHERGRVGARRAVERPDERARHVDGQVDLDRREGHGAERVVERERGVRVRRRVHEETVEAAERLADPRAELPLVVRLARLQADTELGGPGREPRVDRVERVRAVDGGLAHPEQLEVRPREAEHAQPGGGACRGGARGACALRRHRQSCSSSFGAATRSR
jgi:hypothetical protein